MSRTPRVETWTTVYEHELSKRNIETLDCLIDVKETDCFYCRDSNRFLYENRMFTNKENQNKQNRKLLEEKGSAYSFN